VIRRDLSEERADSIVYATARRHGARLVTADTDFEGLPEAIVVR
jgi:predicted nucleic acid-binding protein